MLVGADLSGSVRYTIGGVWYRGIYHNMYSGCMLEGQWGLVAIVAVVFYGGLN